MILKFSRVIEVVKVRVRAQFHQAKCSGSWVINSVLDFAQANITGKDQAIDKLRKALWMKIFPRSGEKIGERKKTVTFDLEIK